MRYFSILVFIVVYSFLFNGTILATPLYNQDGVKLNHFISKYKTIYVESLKKNVVIWKSTFELANESKKSIAVRVPCYLSYVYAYLNPFEISTVQQELPNIPISDVYKNFVAPKPRMLNAKSRISSEKYFATLDNVDLNAATVNWNFKFAFWY